MNEKRSLSARLMVGVLLIIIGGLLILDNYSIISFSIPFNIFDWRIIFIVIGVILFISGSNKATSLILVIVALIGFFPEFWPLVLVFLGLYIIYSRSGLVRKEVEEDTINSINDVAIFGGGKKRINSKTFKGGRITAIFGGGEMDLRGSNLAEGEHVLDMLVIFGGYSFYAPPEWEIEMDVISIFGGFQDERRKEENKITEKSKLVIKGLVLFGGGEVK